MKEDPRKKYIDIDCILRDYGLTKQEYFAAKAMQSMLAAGYGVTSFARYSVECADRLIRELNKSSK